MSAKKCSFCGEYEIDSAGDDRCLNCAYFGPGDPHGVRYYAQIRARENPDQRQLEAEQDLVERVRRAAKEALGS